MNELEIITGNMHVKDAFGSFAILDKVEIVDHPSIYHFARIVSNYLKMQRIGEKRK